MNLTNPQTDALPACMGGWCPMRESCRLYHAGSEGRPSERLCPPGERSAWLPLSVARRDIAGELRA